ncbi:endocuticle structural glycoprotein ABD-4-like [Penaeus monodon]|uniref:endocuticle structural glycoprotein ABD-4-like n=1 Tax=Penaeus monodon TaxID=6687 RepID=UPI0018A75651|nr:endocuticle structural glycoprotein ABD-4-like [Penaeus monodon]
MLYYIHTLSRLNKVRLYILDYSRLCCRRAFAAPQYSSSEEAEFVPILKDDRVQEDDGTYSFDFETGNGISFSQAGSPDGDEDAVIKAGEYSYTAPDGTEIHLRFVADDNGFQPEGDHLPVAPEFPHPIPQFVLDQITSNLVDIVVNSLINLDEEKHGDFDFKSTRGERYMNASAIMRSVIRTV